MKFLPLVLVAMLALPLRAEDGRLQTVVDDAWQGEKGYHFSGRLTETHNAPQKDSGAWKSIYLNTRLLLTSGENGIVNWRISGHEWSIRVGDKGYWAMAANQALDLKPGWYDIETEPTASSQAGFLVADPGNTVGLISDIDDTILVSEVLKKTALLKNSLAVPAELRQAVPGMAALYVRMLRNNRTPEASAVFYVSSSPKQLTDNLRRFLQLNQFPRGVLQLKEIGSGLGDSMGEHEAYKIRHIETILAEFPQLKFFLFGDDGERDPEIYHTILKKYPDRIAGVWIHHVNPDPKRPTYPKQKDVKELLGEEK
jgi:phosphatidate phosphatase APP1